MNNFFREVRYNYDVYHFLVNCAEYYVKKDIKKALLFCQKAASYAVFNYCGFYSEPKLEYLLIRIKKEYLVDKVYKSSKLNKQQHLRVLHYATEVYDVGGHTRLLENWIKNDTDNIHDVILSSQSSIVPEDLNNAVTSTGGIITILSNGDIFSKIEEIKEAYLKYSIIILHHHPNDILPLLALCDNGNIPVAVLNHGDHRYWLGITICDVLIELRENLVEADKCRRGAKNIALIPIPIKKQEFNQILYFKARNELKIEKNEVVLLSIGSKYKYIPIDGKNFFTDIMEILDLNTNARLILVGISADDDLAKVYTHPRIVYVAPTKQLDMFRSACDIYVEGYPFSSHTAYMEVGTLGKPVHKMYDAPLLNKYEMSDYPFRVKYYDSKVHWIEGLNNLIRYEIQREYIGFREQKNMFLHSDNNTWKRYIDKFYDEILLLKHNVPKKIKSIPIIVDSNAFYLHKMQDKINIDLHLYEIYDLNFILKIKLIKLKMYELFKEHIKFRDVLWFLFKA